MHVGRTVFSQLMDLFPLVEFRRCVARYRGNHKVQRFSCLDQFLCLAFAQLTSRESLRDIEVCLRAVQPRLYHMGFRGNIARNTLANANLKRNWRIYAAVAQILIRQARQLYSHENLGLELEQTAYALDSTTIDLCLSLFPWAPFQRTKAAVKVHTLLDLRGSIPSFIRVTSAHVSDVSVLDDLVLEPGACYVMDRGYIHFARLYRFTLAATFFVVRARTNMQYRRRYSHRVDKTTGLRSDQTIVLTGQDSARDYPAPARLIRYWDEPQDLRLRFLTNNFLLPALTIAQLYKRRWDVELFFKWIKVGYPFDSGDHNILWLAIGGPRKGLPIAPRFQACDGHGACVILDRPETQPRGPIACRPASGAPGCILGAVCWRPWIDQTTTPRGYLSQVDTPFGSNNTSASRSSTVHWPTR